jgi:hypothetical protein
MTQGQAGEPPQAPVEPPADAPAGGGEGSGTAMEALIRKRKLQGEQAAPAQAPEPDQR